MTPAGEQRPAALDERARTAPASTVIRPDGGRANAIQSLRADRRRSRGRTIVPTPGDAVDGIEQHAGRDRAAAITARTPDHDAILAAASFDAIPPLPRADAGSSGEGLELVVDLDDLLDQRCLRDEARVGVHQTGRVGEQDEQVGTEELGDERCDAVVVAEADLVVGQGVVLVDDGDHTELEQAFEVDRAWRYWAGP